MENEKVIKNRFMLFVPYLNERQRRLWAASESIALGYGGQSIVSRATGISRRAIILGCKEINGNLGESEDNNRVRRCGSGRKAKLSLMPDVKDKLDELIDPITRGDPESPLRWTCKSVRKLSKELKNQGFDISYNIVSKLLKELGYSLQSNKKTNEGGSHPDRNKQFEFINAKVKKFQKNNQPVISVDTKKKELIGDFKNNGRELSKKGCPEKVNVYDFRSMAKGKAVPYGVYDMTTNSGWVNVGIDHDTSEFAVESIRRWWNTMGKEKYPDADRIFITADGGGSNGYRVRLWKVELQKLADEIGLDISVSHFPPGTSKWNKIEHRLFSFISQNWRGKPLRSHEVIVNLIASTTTNSGLKVKCVLDENKYEKGIKVSDNEMKKIKIIKSNFHGEWNYEIQNSNIVL